MFSNVEDAVLRKEQQEGRRSLAKAFAGGEAVGFFGVLVLLMLRYPFDPDLPQSLACSLTVGAGLVMGLGYFIGLATLALRMRSMSAGVWMVKPIKAWFFGIVCGVGVAIGGIIGNRGHGVYTVILAPVLTMVLSPIAGTWWLVRTKSSDRDPQS